MALEIEYQKGIRHLTKKKRQVLASAPSNAEKQVVYKENLHGGFYPRATCKNVWRGVVMGGKL